MQINPVLQAFLSEPFMMSTSEVALMNTLAERYLKGTLTAAESTPKIGLSFSNFKAKINAEIVADYAGNDAQPEMCCPVLTQDGVLIFPIVGIITKADNYTGAGTATMRQWLAMAAQDTAVKSVLFYVNSGGGQTAGTWELANDIANFQKPKDAYVDGTAASATYYLICSCGKIYSSSPDNLIGSIGTACYIYDHTDYLKNAGVKDRYIYADTSPMKHGGDRAIEADGNEQVYKDNLLNPIDKTFMEFVATQRPQVSKQALQGLEVVASKAIADNTGLIDSIADFKVVYTQISPKKNTQMSKVKLSIDAGLVSNVIALMPGITVVTAEMETAELQAAQTALTEANNNLTVAQAKVIDFEALVATNNTKLSDAEARIVSLQAELNDANTQNATIAAQLATFTKPVTTTPPTPVAAIVPTSADPIAGKKTEYVKNPNLTLANAQFVS